MKKTQESIGQTLRRLREKKQIGIKTVGKALDISYSYISKVENGHRTPSPELVERLSNLYGADADDLLARISELPTDIQAIIQEHGKEVFEVLRDFYAGGGKTRLK
jgi:transcriptional regulator with XRE-family HTH domain